VGPICISQRYAARIGSLSTVGVVAALAAEARALGRARGQRTEGASFGNLKYLSDGSMLAISGIGGAAASAAASALIDAGVSALMTFGTAGGLDPQLAAGSLLLPTAIISAEGTRWVRAATTSAWRERLSARLSTERPVVDGCVVTSAQPVETLADKAALFRDTGAVAVDMESAAVARVAAEHRVPFVCVRVVVDTAADVLPRAVTAASRAGRLQLGRLLLGMALAPADIGALLRLAARYRIALRVLRAVARGGSLAPTELEARP
jgi:adenosylhomocysteine nucleosidase